MRAKPLTGSRDALAREEPIMTDRGPEVETTPARQGQTGTGARWVLRISLALIVVIFAAIQMAAKITTISASEIRSTHRAPVPVCP